MADSRVPTSGQRHEGWSLETAIDYLLAVVVEKHEHALTLITANDKRYEQRFEASQRAIEAAIVAQRDAMNAALISQKEAVEKAERATERRFESVNEFRGTLDNQQRTLIPRSEVHEIRKALEAEIANLTKVIDEFKQKDSNRVSERRGTKEGWGYAVGVIGLVLAILGFASRFIGP